MDIKRTYTVDETLTAQKVCQLINDGKINDLPLKVVNEAIYGTPISVGTGVSIEDQNVYFVSAVSIDETHVFVCYSSLTYNNFLYGVVLTVSNGVVVSGTSTQLAPNSVSYVCATKLDNTHVCIAFRIYSDTGYLYSNVVTISGTTITPGVSTFIGGYDGITDDIHITTVNSSKACVMGRLTNGLLYASILTISGTTITSGTAVACTSSVASQYSALTLLDNTRLVLTVTINGYLCAVVLTINGSSLTVGTLVSSSIQVTYLSVGIVLDSSHLFIAYSNSNVLTSVILTISATTVTIGIPYVTTNPCNSFLSSEKLSPGSVLCCYGDYSNGYARAVLFSISDSTINISSIISCNSVYSQSFSMYKLNSAQIGVSFRNQDNSGKLCTFILTSTMITPAETRAGKAIGIAQDTNGIVMLKGISKGHTGLTAGAKYYYDSTGAISTTSTGTYIGVALSPTEILITDYIID